MPTITLSCSPDADDLFMMRALIDERIDSGSYQFRITTEPTDSLNELASGQGPDVIAISVAHYPAVSGAYQMLPHGGSMGEDYGPVIVSKEPMSIERLANKTIAVPGLTTTAFTTLKMILDFQPIVTPISPYELIFEALEQNIVDAGLIIHEGRLTYEEHGLHKVLDLGEWWSKATGGLPLPLGANAIKRELGPQAIKEISALLKQSIQYALENRDESIEWLLARKGPLNTYAKVSTYLDMYANQRTLDYGRDGRLAVQDYLDRAHQKNLLPQTTVDFAP